MEFLLAVIVVFAVAGISGHGFLLRRLRSHHSELWKELGSPTLIFNNSIANNLSVQRSIRSGRFESLGDPILARTSKALRYLGPVYLLGFMIYLAFLVLKAAA